MVTSLTIEPGAELTIRNTTIEFGDLETVKVKRGGRLIIDNSTLKSRRCKSEAWQGIEVYGNRDKDQPIDPYMTLVSDDPGVLIIKNGSRIQDIDHTALFNYRKNSWDAYFGGLIVAENSYFDGMVRAAEFLKYPRRDRSSFSYCHFTGADVQPSNRRGIAVSIWNCEGITFQQNIFDNYFSRAAIVTLDASYIVSNNNQFINSNIGIKSLASNVFGANTIITDNFFTDTKFGIVSADGGARQNSVIMNNAFFQGTRAISIDGESQFEIISNSIDNFSEEGIALHATRDWVNIIQNNSFSGEEVGIDARGKNSGVIVRENCFDQISENDVFVSRLEANSEIGSLAPSQGTSVRPANNLLSNRQNNQIAQADIYADPNDVDEFTYWIRPGLTAASPLVPFNNITYPGSNGEFNNYKIQPAVQNGTDPCLNGIINPGGPGTGFTKPDFDLAILLREQAKIAYTNNPTAANAEDYTKKAREAAYILQSILYDYFRLKNFNGIEVFLDFYTTKRAKALTVDAAIHLQNEAKANFHLTKYIQGYGSDDFVKTREVAIDLINATSKTPLTPKHISDLTTIANANGPQRAIAGSMLDFFDHKDYIYSATKAKQLKSMAVTASPKSMLPTIRVYPNPANDRLTIQIPTDLANVGYRGGIFSVNGTIVSSVRVAQGATQAQLFLGELSAGVYYLRLTPDVGEAFVKKIVIW